MSTSTTMSHTPKHPGTITFVSDDQSERVEQASAVPESIRFAQNKDGKLTPVVKVVAVVAGDTRTIRSYAADGELLSSTVQKKS